MTRAPGRRDVPKPSSAGKRSPATCQPPDGPAALDQYRRRAAVYDSELTAFEPVRRQAVAALRLRPGDTVLDVGCGTGLSLPLLRAGIGPGGHIVGIEPCPEMIEQARRRAVRDQPGAIELVCAPARTAGIAQPADAALFHFTHDVLRDEQALAHIARHLKPGARVVAAGLQWAPAWLAPVNAFVWLAALYSVTSLEGLERPWSRLAQHLEGLQVRSVPPGAIYIASGTFRGP